jgi:carbon monoxide dehydrogenase subunit G
VKRVEQSIAISATPEEVFDFASSLENIASWQSGISSAELLSDGPIGLGSKALVVRDLLGQHIEAPLEVTAYDRPNLLGLHSEVSGVAADASLVVKPRGHGTRITFAMEIRGSGFTSFIESMIASAAEADITRSLDRLKELIEASN